MARTSVVDQQPKEPLRLVIIGGGVAGCAAASTASREENVAVTFINSGLPLGGTCINTGCLAVHWLREAARLVHHGTYHGLKGMKSEARIVDLKALMGQKARRIAEIQHRNYEQVYRTLDNVEVIDGFARLVDPNTVLVGERRIKADRILLATGSSYAPDEVPGIGSIDYLTGESVLTLETLPSSLIFIGATEMGLAIAQIYARFGVDVVVLESGEEIMGRELGADTIRHVSGYLREEGLNIHSGVELSRVGEHAEGVEVQVRVEGSMKTFVAERLVITTERRPCTRNMGLEEVGIEYDDYGFIKVDEAQQTRVSGIFAAGDVTGRTFQSHRAVHEGTLAAHNAVSTSSTAGHDPSMPFVVYTDPEVAGVGWDEAQARSLGFDADVRVLALRDVLGVSGGLHDRGFVKLVRDRRSDRLIGARIVAPQASEMIMEAVMAVRSGMTSRELAALSHPLMGICDGIRRTAQAFSRPS